MRVDVKSSTASLKLEDKANRRIVFFESGGKMSPSTRPVIKRTATTVRQVQPKVPTRFASTAANLEGQVEQFREARKLREKERLEKLRNCRMKNSAAVGSNALMSIFNSSSAISSRNAFIQSSAVSKPSSLKALNCDVSVQVIVGSSTGSQNDQPSQRRACQSSTNVNRPPIGVKRPPAKLRRSHGGRKSILRLKVRKIPKAEVKLTKTTQLRMLKSDPLLELSMFPSSSSSRQIVLPLPVPAPLSKKCSSFRTVDAADGSAKISSPSQSEIAAPPVSIIKLNRSPIQKSVESSNKIKSQSHIPVRKTSFASPLKRTPVTPKPSPLREKLAEWLENRNNSLDNFKHLQCFGVLGPVVKRPQTPFRKKNISKNMLRVIPESKETSPSKETPQVSFDEDVGELNTTFTLEEEDKENIGYVKQQEPTTVDNNASETQHIRELDQAHGVLSELHSLIQMGYSLEQCGLWLRAVRRRFPQCGDEAIYWECLASLEEARGDLQTALSCYERAILQGAENSVQNTIDELLKKMSALRIEPMLDVSCSKSSKPLESKILDSSNIIKSSSIQFAVQEKCSSAKKNEFSNSTNKMFTATPVRRSVRLAGTPKRGTPGVTCVRSLEFLDPAVRTSLVFQTNNALDPKN